MVSCRALDGQPTRAIVDAASDGADYAGGDSDGWGVAMTTPHKRYMLFVNYGCYEGWHIHLESDNPQELVECAMGGEICNEWLIVKRLDVVAVDPEEEAVE